MPEPIPEIRRLTPEENRNPNHYHSQYYVLSSNGHTVYTVSKLLDPAVGDGTGWQCSCVGWTRHFPRRDCRHIAKARDFAAHEYPRETVARRSLRDIALDARAAAEESQHTLMEDVVRRHFTLYGTTFYICRDCGWSGANPAAGEHENQAEHHDWEDCATLDRALRAIVEHRELIEHGPLEAQERAESALPSELSYRWLSSDNVTVYTVTLAGDMWRCSRHGAVGCVHVNKVKDQIRSALRTYTLVYVRQHPGIEWTRCACGWYGPTSNAAPHYSQHRALGQEGTTDESTVFEWVGRAANAMGAEIERARLQEQRETQEELGVSRRRAAERCTHDRRARMFIDGKWERCGVCQVVVPVGS